MSNWKSIDIIYVYDNTFYGLLSVIFECFSNKHIPLKITTTTDINFLNKYVNVSTNETNALRVYNGILTNITYHCLHTIYNAFLSNMENKELVILQYLIIGFRVGPKVDNMLCENVVSKLQQFSKKVSREAHKLTRFS